MQISGKMVPVNYTLAYRLAGHTLLMCGLRKGWTMPIDQAFDATVDTMTIG